jgi:SOS-response transcriptional repressor LexA
MEPNVDPVRQLIHDRLSELRLRMSDVSKALGKNHAYIHQYLERGIPARLPELVREKLAEILQVPEAQLRNVGLPIRTSYSGRIRGAQPPPGRTMTEMIPVHGVSQGGGDGWLVWSDEVVDYVPRLPQLAGATQAYATYIVSSDMEPRYNIGEVVYVHPGKPVTPGAFVLVQVQPDKEGEPQKTFIRRFVKRTAAKLTFEQFNPPKEIDLKASSVSSMHRIVASAESGGI